MTPARHTRHPSDRRVASAICVTIALGLAAASIAGKATPGQRSRAETADRVYAQLRALWRAEGARALPRRPALDEVAVERARTIAELPRADRQASRDALRSLIQRTGVKRFRRVTEYVGFQEGYDDPASAAVEGWRSDREGWVVGTEPGWDALGVGAASSEDGTLVLVVVLVEDAPVPSDLAATEAATEAAVNVERRKRGLPDLAHLDVLGEIARSHSQDMARRHYFAHESPEGRSVVDRASVRGIGYRRLAENIAENKGAPDPVRTAVQGWMASPSHRASILDTEVTETGIGIAVDDDGGIYFTQVFLRPPEAKAGERRSR